LVRIWKEVVMAEVKVVPRNLPGKSIKDYEKRQLEQPMSGPTSEEGMYGMRGKNVNRGVRYENGYICRRHDMMMAGKEAITITGIQNASVETE
jgi:hypothetical protein